MEENDKPEPPVWVGPSATLDIDALLDAMRRDRRDKEATRCPRERSTS